jgi:quinol monooxygenase YgiN
VEVLLKRYYTVIVKFKTTSDKKEDFKKFLESIIPVALKSSGCNRHDLHQSLEDGTEFLFYENWSSKKAHEKHVLKQEVQKWRSKLADFLVQPYEISFWETSNENRID